MPPTGSIPPSSWMGLLPDKSVSLTQLTLPATHDSYCSESKLELGIASLNPSFAACQHDDFTIEAQLEAGVRVLDFRVEFDGKLSHGVARLKGNLYSEVEKAARFLENHPSETILVSVKWELEEWSWGSVKGTPEPNGEAEKIVQRLKEVPGSKWWMNPTVPTLEQAAGQLVLLTRLSESANFGIRYNPGSEKLQDTPAKYCSQDKYDMSGKDINTAQSDKWRDHVMPFLLRARENPKDDILYFNFCSAYAGDGTPWGGTVTPAEVAAGVNRDLEGFMHAHVGRPVPSRFGVVLMDFPRLELLQAMIAVNVI